MKTIILSNPGEFQIIERPKLTAPVEGEAIIKIKRIGICGTDYHAYNGNQPFFTYPRVLGHEIGAEIVAIGNHVNHSHLNIGDKVSLEPYINCGYCQACGVGKTNCCENLAVMGVHMDGGMTEFMKVPIRKLHISNSLSFDQLALVETLGIGLHAVNRSRINKNDKILILGAGPIGLSVAQFAKLSGAYVAVADRLENRLKFTESIGLSDASILINEPLTSKKVKECFSEDLPTIIFDATGNKDSMQNAFNIASNGATIVFVGLFQGEISFNDPNFHRRELTLMSSRNALPADFKKIITLMEEGRISTLPWLSHRLTFDELPKSFETLLHTDQQVIKAMISI